MYDNTLHCFFCSVQLSCVLVMSIKKKKQAMYCTSKTNTTNVLPPSRIYIIKTAEHSEGDCASSWHLVSSLGLSPSRSLSVWGRQFCQWGCVTAWAWAHTPVHVPLWSQSFINSAREICIHHPPYSYLCTPLWVLQSNEMPQCTHTNTLTCPRVITDVCLLYSSCSGISAISFFFFFLPFMSIIWFKTCIVFILKVNG